MPHAILAVAVLAETTTQFDPTPLIAQGGIAGATLVFMILLLRQFSETQNQLRLSDQERLTQMVKNLSEVGERQGRVADMLQSTANVLQNLTQESRELLREVRLLKNDTAHRE